jgi:hypothetical protein
MPDPGQLSQLTRGSGEATDHHFRNLFDRHNELDQRIQNMESGIEAASHLDIEAHKKEKLLLKDRLYAILKKAAGTTAA